MATLNRQIVALALPALGALVAEPLLILVDSAFVAHVSTEALAGLGIASTVLQTVIGLAIFLAYSTTADVARAVGAGDMRRAISKGVDATWLALMIGIGVVVLLAPLAGVVTSWFNPSDAVATQAVTYLRISTFGIPAMLMIQAASGLVRGLQNTRTTLYISLAGVMVNIPLNWWLIFHAGLGIAGSAIGTIICQWGMAAAYLVVIIQGARRHDASLGLRFSDISDTWSRAKWLIIRTAALRIAMIVMTVVATRLGSVALAAHQLMNSIYGMSAMALDALAIAAQALTGKYLGAGDKGTVRTITDRVVTWSLGGGAVVAGILLVIAIILPDVFTPDAEVQRTLTAMLIVFLVAQPLAGYVFVLDGVLTGAGDTRYLAGAMTVALAVFLPFAGSLAIIDPDGIAGPTWLWAIFTFVFLGARAATLRHRIRQDAWMRID